MENQDPIKNAFSRAKQDILDLQNNLYSLSLEVQELRQLLTDFINFNQQSLIDFESSIKQTVSQTVQQSVRQSISENSTASAQLPLQLLIEELKESLINLEKEVSSLKSSFYSNTPAHSPEFQTNRQIIPADNPAHPSIPADKLPLYSLKDQYLMTSTGNRGVPADSQTVRQTDQQTQNPPSPHTNAEFQEISQLLSSIDGIKDEVRIKFKNLTSQEMLIFSTIYQLEEEKIVVDYPSLALKLSLTESSIRDYVQRLIKKGIPLIKTKENNKKILISISPDLKKIASLSSIIKLKDEF